jgi:hypothetical protein
VPVWHYESTCIFSVKSAYKLAFDTQRWAQFNSGNSGTGDFFFFLTVNGRSSAFAL